MGFSSPNEPDLGIGKVWRDKHLMTVFKTNPLKDKALKTCLREYLISKPSD